MVFFEGDRRLLALKIGISSVFIVVIDVRKIIDYLVDVS